MKTMEQWNDSGENFQGFINPGDEVDSEIFDHFLGAVPPAFMREGLFLMGEPYTHNEENQAMYMTFIEKPDGKYFYLGLKTVQGVRAHCG